MKSTPKFCVNCRKSVSRIVRCPECVSGVYCSDICVRNHESEHSVICAAILELEKFEKEKIFAWNMSESKSELPYKLNREIIRLVGEKPVIGVKSNNVD